MTLAEFQDQKLHLRVAELWDNEVSARIALERIGYPRMLISAWEGRAPLAWWMPIFTALDLGVQGVPGGLEDLLGEAARHCQWLADFARFSASPAPGRCDATETAQEEHAAQAPSHQAEGRGDRLNLRIFMEMGLLRAIAGRYQKKRKAQMFVQEAGFEDDLPRFKKPLAFFYEVFDQVDKGARPGSLEAFLRVAAKHFPHAEEFTEYR